MDMREQIFSYTGFALSEGDRTALKMPVATTLVAAQAENCRCARGALKRCLGLEYIYDPYGRALNTKLKPKMIRMLYYNVGLKRQYYAALIGEDDCLYGYDVPTRTFQQLSLKPGRECCLCPLPDSTGEPDFYVLTNDEVDRVDGGLTLAHSDQKLNNRAACIFRDRFFYSAGRTVVFSEAGDFDDFSSSAYGGGSVEVLDGLGNVLQLVVYQNSILLFKENSILRLEGAGAADEFRVERLPYYGRKIVRNSAALCGKYVLFMTDAGDIFRMDGNRFERLVEGVPSEFCFDDVGVASDGERYFLSNGERTLVFEAEDGSRHELYPLRGITSTDGVAVGEWNKYICRIVPNGFLPTDVLPRFFAEGVALKDGKEKWVKRLLVYGEGTVRVAFGSGGRTVEGELTLSDKGAELPVDVKGKAFDWEIQFLDNGCVRRIDVEFSEMEGGK